MKKQKFMSHMKGQDKTQEKQLNEEEIGNLPEKEFRIMIVKMIQDLGKRMEAKIEKMQEMFFFFHISQRFIFFCKKCLSKT